MSDAQSQDRWSAWVLQRGHSGDDDQLRKKIEHLTPIRDRVLDRAELRPDDTLLDVGTGDGLIAFGALSRLGDCGRVIFSDTSQALVDHCRELAIELGVEDRAVFVRADADDLGGIEAETVDVVTTRSVLIYVDDKQGAFREFYRVLRPGGRASLFEPINNYFPFDSSDFWGFDAGPVRDLVEKLWAHEGWTDQASGDDPMMNFNERDLVDYALAAGFREVRLELDVEVRPGSWVVDWERLLDLAPNPNASTTRDLLDAALTPEERERYIAHMKPLIDSGNGTIHSAFAYLYARKVRG
jgi:SAM-dependent methyltransferase